MPLNIKFYLDELIYIYKKSRSEYIFLTVIYFLTLLIFSTFLQSFSYVSKLITESASASYMKVFIADSAPKEDLTVIQKILGNNPLIKKVDHISKERAMEEFKDRFPRYAPLLEMFKTSPFPSNLEIKFKNQAIATSVIPGTSEFLSRIPWVMNVQHNYHTSIGLYKIQKTIVELGTALFTIFMILYIPLNLSFLRSIFEREKKLFTLTEIFGSSKTPLSITFIVSHTIPLIITASIILFLFHKLSTLFKIPLWPVAMLVGYFFILQILFSIDILEK